MKIKEVAMRTIIQSDWETEKGSINPKINLNEWEATEVIDDSERKQGVKRAG